MTRIDYGRSSKRALAIFLSICGGILLICVIKDPPPLDDSWLSLSALLPVGFVLLIGYVLVLVVQANRQLRRMPVIELDEEGLWLCYPDADHILPWDALNAVGLSYRRRWAYSAMEMVREGAFRIRHAWALELYPASSDAEEHHSLLSAPACSRLELPPPKTHPELPPFRYLVFVPGEHDGPEAIEEAVLRYAPDLWIGWHKRPTTRVDRRSDAKRLA